MKLYFTGDSHIDCIRFAIEEERTSLQFESNGRPIDIKASRILSFPQTQKEFFRTRSDDLIGSHASHFIEKTIDGAFLGLTGHRWFLSDPNVFYCISMPYTTSLIVWSETWLRFRPWFAEGAGDQVVSSEVFRRIVEHHFRNIFALLQSLKESGVGFLVLESPPLREDDRGIQLGRTTPSLALRIDGFVRDCLDQALHRIGVDVVTCPENAYYAAPRGSFMRGDLRRIKPDDFHHGNSDYGAMMLEKTLLTLVQKGTIEAVEDEELQPAVLTAR